MQDETLRDAFRNLEELSMTHKEYLEYESRLKWIMDEEAAKREAELRLKEGIERGIQEGIEQTKKSIVKNLLSKGMEIDFIVETTGMAKCEVLEIKNMKNNKA